MSHRFVVLDALRGLCAIFVCLFHFRVNSPIATSPFVMSSWQFVDFFFVLSGFVIAANYRQKLAEGMSRWRFLGLRLARIYPLHIFVLGLFVLTELAGAIFLQHTPGLRPMFDAGHAPIAIPLHILMLHSFGLVPGLTWNDPAWSIAVEFWAYVAFAIIVPYLGRRLDAVLILVVVACPLVLLAVTPWGINVTWNWGVVRCFYGFALGALSLSVWQRAGTMVGGNVTVWTAIELVAVAALVGFVVATGTSQWNLLGPPLFTVVLLVFAHERGRISRVLATPPLLFLGTISYSIYMMHSFVQARLDDVLKIIDSAIGVQLTTAAVRHGLPVTLCGATSLQGTLLVGVMLLIVIGVSYITYMLIEMPGQRWTRARFNRTTPVVG